MYLSDPGKRQLVLYIENGQCVRAYVLRKIRKGSIFEVLVLGPDHETVFVLGNPRAVPHIEYHVQGTIDVLVQPTVRQIGNAASLQDLSLSS